MMSVTVDVRGLSPALGPPVLFLENWGEWIDVDNYVTALSGSPAVQPRAGTEYFEPVLPKAWDGCLHVQYTIGIAPHGSEQHRTHGLLPWRLHDTAAGYAHNTLMQVLQNNEPIKASITVDLKATEGSMAIVKPAYP